MLLAQRGLILSIVRNRYRTAIGTALTVLLCAVIMMGSHLLTQLRALSTDASENMRWTTTQLDNEFANLSALLSKSLTEANPASVNLRANIALSRLGIIQSGQTAELFEGNAWAQDMIAKLDAYADAAVVILDDPSGLDRTALRALRDLTEDVRPTIRQLAVLGVELGSENSAARRAEFLRQLAWTGGSALVLMLALGGLLIVLDRLRERANQRDAELRESSKQLQTTIAASQDGILQIDHQGRIIGVNQAAAALFGWRPGEAVGRVLETLLFPEHLRRDFRAERMRFEQDGVSDLVDAGQIETSGESAKGEEFPLEMSLASVTDGGNIRYIAYLRDISERKINERKLIDARDQAERTDRAKSRFLAVMSHEMRTPLNGVLGVLDLLKTTELTKQQARYAEIATASGEVLLEHVNEALDVTRAETGSLLLNPNDFDLAAMVEGVIDVLEPLAEEKGLSLDLESPSGPRRWFHGDGNRIRQILTNLIGNAIKFTDTGGITVGIEILNAPNETLVTLWVSDSGPGISDDLHDRIFDDFVAMAPSGGRQSRGDGLGLSISRRIARQMGGDLTLSSGSDRGATFVLKVPLLRSAKPVTTADHRTDRAFAPAKQRNVLVVEDNTINRRVLGEMLFNLGHRSREAVDGRDCLSLAAEERFDLIFMDISMPVMDGIEATRALRQREGPNQHTPVIGLTAHGREEFRSQAEEAGMTLFYSKPIRFAVLRQLMLSTDTMPELESKPTTSALDELTSALGPEKVQQSLATFFDELDQLIASLHAPAEQGTPNPADQLHKTKGAAALFGFRDLENCLDDLERLARDGTLAVNQSAVTVLQDAALTARGQMAAE